MAHVHGAIMVHSGMKGVMSRFLQQGRERENEDACLGNVNLSLSSLSLYLLSLSPEGEVHTVFQLVSVVISGEGEPLQVEDEDGR